MSHNDATRLYYRVLWRLAELADRGMSFLLCESQEIADTRRAPFLNELYKASNFIFRLTYERSYTLEICYYRPLWQMLSMARKLLSRAYGQNSDTVQHRAFPGGDAAQEVSARAQGRGPQALRRTFRARAAEHPGRSAGRRARADGIHLSSDVDRDAEGDSGVEGPA